MEAIYAVERDRLVEQLEGLDAASWRTASLCDGWTVRDLCAHLLMPYELGFGAMIPGLIRARLNFDTFARRWAINDGRSGIELTAAIAQTSAAGFSVPGAGELAPVAHLVIHAGDARHPLGLDRAVSSEASSRVLDDLTSGKHSVGKDRLRGLRFTATDTAWSFGDGPDVRGDGATLLSALNGRRPAAGDLTGEGAGEFRSRLA